MSTRTAQLRSALHRLINAVSDIDTPLPEDVIAALGNGVMSLHGTRFVAPENFPCTVSSRCGVRVELFGLRNGLLIGAFTDTDSGTLDLRTWQADGSMFCRNDPDPLDLVLPDDEEEPALPLPVPAADCVVIPFMGRIS